MVRQHHLNLPEDWHDPLWKLQAALEATERSRILGFRFSDVLEAGLPKMKCCYKKILITDISFHFEMHS
jgi:hypothetical protein